MPIYEYVCSDCGKVQDVLQKVSDPTPEKCESCGKPGTLSRVVSRTSFVLKGGGWYSDLYSSTKKGGGEGSGGAKASSGAPSTGTSAAEPAKAAPAAAAPAASSSDGKKA